MNRTQFTAMYTRLAQTRTKYTECIRITRTDGTQYRFTAHDKPLKIVEVDDRAYEYTPANSFELTAIETQLGLVVSNMDIKGIIDDDAIAANDLRAGLFDHARVDVFIAYWSGLRVRMLPLRTSWIGELQVRDQEFRVDLRGIAGRLAQMFIETTSLECRWQFCDANCGLDEADHRWNTNVLQSIAADTFTITSGALPSGFSVERLNYGRVDFLDGDNAGLSMEIINAYGNRVRTFLPMPFPIADGDSIRVVEGCDKRFSTCCNTFENGARFGGEPWLKGSDVLTQYPNSISSKPRESDGVTVINETDTTPELEETPTLNQLVVPEITNNRGFELGSLTHWTEVTGTGAPILWDESDWDDPAIALTTVSDGNWILPGGVQSQYEVKQTIDLSKLDWSIYDADDVFFFSVVVANQGLYSGDHIDVIADITYDDATTDQVIRSSVEQTASKEVVQVPLPNLYNARNSGSLEITLRFVRDGSNTGENGIAVTNTYMLVPDSSDGVQEGIGLTSSAITPPEAYGGESLLGTPTGSGASSGTLPDVENRDFEDGITGWVVDAGTETVNDAATDGWDAYGLDGNVLSSTADQNTLRVYQDISLTDYDADILYVIALVAKNVDEGAVGDNIRLTATGSNSNTSQGGTALADMVDSGNHVIFVETRNLNDKDTLRIEIEFTRDPADDGSGMSVALDGIRIFAPGGEPDPW